jgi:hypothetical protein
MSSTSSTVSGDCCLFDDLNLLLKKLIHVYNNPGPRCICLGVLKTGYWQVFFEIDVELIAS